MRVAGALGPKRTASLEDSLWVSGSRSLYLRLWAARPEISPQATGLPCSTLAQRKPKGLLEKGLGRVGGGAPPLTVTRCCFLPSLCSGDINRQQVRSSQQRTWAPFPPASPHPSLSSLPQVPPSLWVPASAKWSWSLLGDPAETQERLGPSLDPPVTPSVLQARTQAWFKHTQASRICQQGELPPWFHGFISRRDTEQLLQDKPLGSFLIRFSESTVGFVLSYRGRDRCRHFILDQLEDERYVILGEDSAHAELQGLLQHYTIAPVTPYYEFLTVPCTRVRTTRPEHLLPPAVCRHRWKDPCFIPLLPAKAGPAQRLSSPMQEAAASADPYTQVSREPVPTERPAPAQPPEIKYQQLMRFHTYAEPHEGFLSPERRIYYEPDEPIPFYATGRGSLVSPDPENVYAEVELACQALPEILKHLRADSWRPSSAAGLREQGSQAGSKRKPDLAHCDSPQAEFPSTGAKTAAKYRGRISIAINKL
uniref:SH2 domain containing 2A n=1 Tax=Pelusios castaneus TaxID=367368 RepID=A0A8C8SLX5_9SAUR